jgi:hypothetical protein
MKEAPIEARMLREQRNRNWDGQNRRNEKRERSHFIRSQAIKATSSQT